MERLRSHEPVARTKGHCDEVQFLPPSRKRRQAAILRPGMPESRHLLRRPRRRSGDERRPSGQTLSSAVRGFDLSLERELGDPATGVLHSRSRGTSRTRRIRNGAIAHRVALAGEAKRKSNMDKRIIRALIIAMVLMFWAAAPRTARAQNAQEPTQIVVGAPTQSKLGETLTVQAVLADSQGHPISKALIYFTTETNFLSEKSDVILAQAVTNGNGQAVAHFVNDFSGPFTLRAEFRGDTQYAPSNATIQTSAVGGEQVYAEHVGVDIPGFNVPPVSPPMASVQSQQNIWRFIQNLWPAMNGWTVAA